MILAKILASGTQVYAFMEDAYCILNTTYEKFPILHVVVSDLEDPTKEGPLGQAEVTVDA
jgi:hypothetical protein